MKKILKRMFFLLVVVCSLYTGALLANQQDLYSELICLHMVESSDSNQDPAIKLQVRDAVEASLKQALADAIDVSQAKEYIEFHLPQIQAAANRVLRELGASDATVVTLLREAFPTGDDSFSFSDAINGGENYRIRFFLLELLGRVENFFCSK